MALYRTIGRNAVLWRGEPLPAGKKKVRHPMTIELLWTEEELAAIGLRKPAPADPVPEGKVVLSTTVKIVDGRPKTVHELGDAPPLTADQVLRRRAKLLAETDHYFLKDRGAAPKGMKEYRQALRDITKQEGFPAVEWPEPPKL